MTIRLPSPLAQCVFALAMISLLCPGESEAQARPAAQSQSSAASWPAPSVGVHLGYDQVVRGTLVGGQVRVPVLRSGRLELLGIGNTIFVTGLREYQFDLDAVYSPAGRRGGVYFGGGLSYRNTIFGPDLSAPRETRQGYGVVVGLQSGGLVGPFLTQFEFRWVFLPGNIDPKMVSLGLNFPLWGRASRQGGGFGS